MSKKRINRFNNAEVIFLVTVSAIVGLVIGYYLTRDKENVDYDSTLKEFIKIYDEINEKYYEEIDKEELLSGAVNGMLSSLDQHTTLVDKEEDENFLITLDGSYKGVGIEVSKRDGAITIVGVLADSPAKKAGIEVGDIVKAIDDISYVDKETKDVSDYIRKNENKNEFTITVLRDDEELTFNLVKETVTLKSVASEVIERDGKKIGYIYVAIFSKTTALQFSEKLKELEEQNIDSLIIDLRQNSGGHLSTAVTMLKEMLGSDKVIYKVEKNGKVLEHYSLGKKSKEYPIAIIIDKGSASASELFTASLRDNLGAKVVGVTSYGKGTVQEYNYLSNGDMYKFTTKKWLTPNGDCIDGVGIKPDVEVSLSEEYFNEPTDDNDDQLQAAINELLK